jgi:MFS family permease
MKWSEIAGSLRNTGLLPVLAAISGGSCMNRSDMADYLDVAALFVLYPYLTIHMRELGINVEETAIMSAVTPVVAIVMPPIAGMVADRIGNFRVRLKLPCWYACWSP